MSGRPGFRFEKDLLAVLREKSACALNVQASAIQVLTEVQVGTCIPDLLIVCGDRREEMPRHKLTYFECTIVAAMMKAGLITVDEIADATFAPREEILKRVSRLVRLGLIEHRDSQLRVASRALPNKLRVIAVEAKLTRWKDALEQARAYLSFANEAYIAMPASLIRRNVSALSGCADSGVGVIAVEDNDSSVVLPAVCTRTVSAEWLRVVSTAISVPQGQPRTSMNASFQGR